MFIELFAVFKKDEVGFVFAVGAVVVVMDAFSVDFDVIVVGEVYQDVVTGQLVSDLEGSDCYWFVVGSVVDSEAVSQSDQSVDLELG